MNEKILSVQILSLARLRFKNLNSKADIKLKNILEKISRARKAPRM